jgi:hypothetical protein
MNIYKIEKVTEMSYEIGAKQVFFLPLTMYGMYTTFFS